VTAQGPAGVADLHSHLVPGVDDGARSLEEAADAVARMAAAGIGRIVTTPHLNASLTRDAGLLAARLEDIDVAWQSLAEHVTRRFPQLQLLRGHEVMLDVPDPDFSDTRLRLAGTSFVLVEWPRLQIPPKTQRVIEWIVRSGYRPILAHPERYSGMKQALNTAGAWRSAGAYLQVNHGSFAGRYGPYAGEVAAELLARGWVDLLSSDFHARADLEINLKEAEAFFSANGGQEQFQLLTVGNPGRVIADEPPQAVPPLRARKGIWDRFTGIFKGR
jgi:protein-tyrosine phosphatase